MGVARTAIASVVVGVLVLAAAFGVYTVYSQPGEVTVSGVVEGVDRNLLGQPGALELISADLGRLRIGSVDSGESMEPYVGRLITATGKLEETEDGARVLHVSQFRPL